MSRDAKGAPPSASRRAPGRHWRWGFAPCSNEPMQSVAPRPGPSAEHGSRHTEFAELELRLRRNTRQLRHVRSERNARNGPVGAHPRLTGHCSNAGGLSAVLPQALYRTSRSRSHEVCALHQPPRVLKNKTPTGIEELVGRRELIAPTR